MKKLKLTGLALMAAVLASCGGSTSSDTQDKITLLQLTNNKDAEKADLFLRLVDQTETDSSTVFVAKSLYNTDTVGVKLEVLKNIKPGINADGRPIEDGFVDGAIKLSSIGVASDNFVKAVGDILKVQTSAKMTQEVLLPTVFSSNNKEVDLTKQSNYRFKLFFDNKLGEPAEVFAVVDMYKKSFEISEKDSTYRDRFISALQGE